MRYGINMIMIIAGIWIKMNVKAFCEKFAKISLSNSPEIIMKLILKSCLQILTKIIAEI